MSTNAPQTRPTDIVTPPVRLAFPALFVPRPKHPRTPEKITYQATLLLPPTLDLKPYVAAIQAAAVAKWGSVPPLAGRCMPLKDAGTKKYKGFVAGWRYFKAESKFEPQVRDQAKQPVFLVGPTATPEERERARLIAEQRVFAGCWVRAYVGAYAWQDGADRGVSFNLNAIQLVRADDRLDGRLDADQVFDEIDVSEDAPPAAAGAPAQAGRSAQAPAAPAADPLAGMFGGAAPAPAAQSASPVDELSKFM